MHPRLIALSAFLLIALPLSASAASPTLLLRHKHFLYTIPAADTATWTRTEETWLYGGKPVVPPAEMLIDSDTPAALPEGFERSTTQGYSRDAIRETLRKRVSANFDRNAGSVVISRSASGTIVFDGVGLPGRQIDLERTTDMILEALRLNVRDITFPVLETAPEITVHDPALEEMGIQEVVTVGESNFAGSPANRRHNIATGLSKFNGHLITQGETFSFGAELGPVDGTTGYLRELVIKGDRTEPDYGGGLCQVSTTAYRGAWEYGFPIKQRINHSYSVSYYGPVGTDATVYPPKPDMQFVNDSPGALLMQTHQENDHAYFIYYGTRDTRQTQLAGPFIWGHKPVPPDRTIETTELPPGVRRKLGERHPGLSAAWVRIITDPAGKQTEETFTSIYQARPLFYEVGVAALSTPDIPDNVIDINTPEPPRTF